MFQNKLSDKHNKPQMTLTSSNTSLMKRLVQSETIKRGSISERATQCVHVQSKGVKGERKGIWG